MQASVDFVSLGEQRIDDVPLRCVPLAEPNAVALYNRRLEAMNTCKKPYMCFVDGGDDICLPGFVEAMLELANYDMALGYAAELYQGMNLDHKSFTLKAFIGNHSLIHHGVVCRTSDLQAIDWPQGCYSWEVIAYGTLAQLGCVYDPIPRYDWRPGPGGARLWASYSRAILNSKRWLQGLPVTTIKGDLES